MAAVRTLSFSFFSFLRRSSSLEEELELLSLSLELSLGIGPGRGGASQRRVGKLRSSQMLAVFLGLPALLNGRPGHAIISARHLAGRGATRCIKAEDADPFEGPKNMLKSLRLKGMQRALEEAVARDDMAEVARLRVLIDANTPGAPTSASTPGESIVPSDSESSDMLVLKERMASIEASSGVTRIAAPGCHCGAEPLYDNCCGPLHTDAEVAALAGPLETLLARYSAYCEATAQAADYVIDTTHRNNTEWSPDREAWRQKILDFSRTCGFDRLRILQTLNFRLTPQGLDLLEDEEAARGPAQEGDRAYITWTARLRVLEGIVGDDYVEVKDFVERSIFVRDQGRWLYLGGDPDFEPKNIRVSGPLDQPPSGGGSGDFGRRISGLLSGLTGRK